MFTCKFISDFNFSSRSNIDFNLLSHSCHEIISLFRVQNYNFNNLSFRSRWHIKRSIFNIFRLIPKDRLNQFFLWSKFSFSFWSDLTDQNVSTFYNRTNSNDSIFIKIRQFSHCNTWDIISCFFRSKLGLCDFDFIFRNND